MSEYLQFWLAKYLVEFGVSIASFIGFVICVALFINWCERKRDSS